MMIYANVAGCQIGKHLGFRTTFLDKYIRRVSFLFAAHWNHAGSMPKDQSPIRS